MKTPTCIEKGAYYLQCTRCGDEKTEERSATGEHSYVLEGEQKPTCTQDGGRMYRCSVCEGVKSEILNKVGHNWQAVSALAANCQSAKVITYECSMCGDKKTETEGSKTDHSWQLTYSEPATCAADGYKSYKCAFCSETKMETIPATGNCSWGNWIVVTPASCDQDGLKVAECSVCGDTKKETIPAEGAHDYKTTATKDPTCDADGSKTYTCSKCGKTKNETLKATGHNWDSGAVTKEPTCTAEGTRTFTWSKCGKTKTESIKATGHNWQDGKVIKAATCTADGKASSVCTKCNATDNNRTIPKLGHSWGEWTVTKEATEKATGTKERLCKKCGVQEIETIPKKSVKPTATPKPTKKPSSSGKSNAKLEAEYGTVEVFTTSGKVNMRSGPSKDKGRVMQVDKRNTNLGELLDAEADNKGVVWFKVKYKGKNGWLTSDYAKAVVGEPDGSTRRIEGKETELTNLYLKSVSEALDVLTLEDDGRYDIYETEVSNEAVLLCGNDYVEVIELTGKGYTIYGVKVGDKIKDAQKKFKKVNLVLDYDSADEHVYNIICSQDSLFIDEHGLDGTLTVVVSDGKVESMRLEASSPAEE